MLDNKQDKSFSKKVGDKIRFLRISRKLSQEDLAYESNLHRTYIGSIERGERNITLINLKKITDALQINLTEFFSNLH